MASRLWMQRQLVLLCALAWIALATRTGAETRHALRRFDNTAASLYPATTTTGATQDKAKLLVMVLSGGVKPVYAFHRAMWRLLAARVRAMGVQVYLVSTLPGISKPVMDRDTIHFPELSNLDTAQMYDYNRYVAMSVDRYVEMMDYVLHAQPKGHDAPYILRTTLASFWHFPRLLTWLRTQPTTNFSSGVFVKIEDGTNILSGAGFILSSDVARRVMARSGDLNRTTPDDVSLGRLLHSMNVPLTPMTRNDKYTFNVEALPVDFADDADFYHWRLHTGWPESSAANPMQDASVWASLYFYHYGPTMHMAHEHGAIDQSLARVG